MFHQRPTHRFELLALIALGCIFTRSVGTTKCYVEAFTTRRVLFHSRPSSRWRQRPDPCSKHLLLHQTKSVINSLHLSNKNDGEYDPRDNFGRSIRGLQSSALKTTVEVGDLVVCKQSLPSLGILENASYEVMSIYTQSFNEETQQIVKQPLSSLDDANTTTRNKVYMTLFSPEHHSEAVIVTPEEVGLVTVRNKLGSAVWLAVPGLFWVGVIASFFNTYHERTGGSFSDAFWGR